MMKYKFEKINEGTIVTRVDGSNSFEIWSVNVPVNYYNDGDNIRFDSTDDRINSLNILFKGPSHVENNIVDELGANSAKDLVLKMHAAGYFQIKSTDEIIEEGINLYDKSDTSNDNNGWLNNNNIPQTHVSATHTKYFKIKEGDQYWYLNSYGASTNLVVVDINLVVKRVVEGTVNDTITFLEGESFVRFSVRDKNNFMFSKGDTIGVYKNFIKKNINPFEINYSDIGVVCFGDSITKLPESWVSTFDNILKVKYINNLAISGQKIAWKAGTVETSNPPNNGHDNNVLWNSIKKWELTTPESPDAIIIALGTNDISQGSILGDFTNAFSQDEPSTTQLTMANAYRKAVHYLLTNYPNTQIFYCNPLQSKTGGRNYSTISNVGNILIDVSKRYGVKVIDVTNECGVTQEFENVGVAGRYLYDGTHPTSSVSVAGSEVGVEFGSVMQGNYIASQFKKKFIFK